MYRVGDPRRGVEISSRDTHEIGVADVVFPRSLKGVTSATDHFSPLENGDFAGVSAVTVFGWFGIFHWGFSALIAHKKAALRISRRIMDDAPILDFSVITEEFPPTLNFAIIVVYGFAPAVRAGFRVVPFLVASPKCCPSSIRFRITPLVSFVAVQKYLWRDTCR